MGAVLMVAAFMAVSQRKRAANAANQRKRECRLRYETQWYAHNIPNHKSLVKCIREAEHRIQSMQRRTAAANARQVEECSALLQRLDHAALAARSRVLASTPGDFDDTLAAYDTWQLQFQQAAAAVRALRGNARLPKRFFRVRKMPACKVPVTTAACGLPLLTALVFQHNTIAVRDTQFWIERRGDVSVLCMRFVAPCGADVDWLDEGDFTRVTTRYSPWWTKKPSSVVSRAAGGAIEIATASALNYRVSLVLRQHFKLSFHVLLGPQALVYMYWFALPQ